MHAYASFRTLGSPRAPGDARLPSVSLRKIYVLRCGWLYLLSVQQAREHNYTATYSHVDRPVTALCSGSSLSRTVEGRNELQRHCTASCIKLQPSRHA